MSSRDRLTSVNIAPGSIVRTAYFNLSTASSMEYNIDDENQRRSEHSIVDFVVTIPTFYDDEFEAGYVAADALNVSRNSGDTSKIDINAGTAYIGGRRYKQISNNTAYDITGSTNAAYYIRMKYTLSTNTFTFMVETVAGGETADSNTTKYLTLASATWNQTSGYWENDFADLRSTNTSLPPPITFAGSTVGSILTLQQDSTGLALEVIGNAGGGGVKFFDTTNGRNIDVYGDGSNGITIHNAALYNVTLTADNTGRLLVSNDIKATAGYFGSAPIILSGTTIQDLQTLTFKTSATVSGTSGAVAIAFSGLNFTGVGAIGAASLDSVGNVQGSILISDIAIGTAPLTVTSTTKVSNLNVDAVDSYHFTGASGNVTADASELNKIDGFTGDVDDLNKIIESGRTLGDMLYTSATSTLSWLTAANGVLRMTSGVPAWTLTPTFTGLTVAYGTGITFDAASGTDPVITAKSTGGELYFGDTILIADKETTPDWKITGAGAATFVSTSAPTITAGTTLSVTSGPSLTSAGIATAKALSGVTTINSTGAWVTTSTIDFSGILSGATKTEINASADATGRAKGDLRYASAADTLGWLAVGSDGQYLKLVSGLPSWQTLPTYDNYGSWTYAIGGASQDAMTTGTTLDFIAGTNLTIADTAARQITFNVTSTSTATDASTVPITSDWAYDHAVGQTVNLHTKVSTITSGTWQGTAIANTYVAGLDQNCLQASSPTFAGVTITSGPILSVTGIAGSSGDTITGFTSLTLAGAISGVTTIDASSYVDCSYLRAGSSPGAVTNNICYGNASGAGLVAEIINESGYTMTFAPGSGRMYFGGNGVGYGFTNGDIYCTGLKIANAYDITPETASTSECGTSTYYWQNVYSYNLYHKTAGVDTTFDHLDDLAIIDSIIPMNEKSEDGIPLADFSGVPKEIISEDGWTRSGNMQMLVIGSVKQLHNKVKDLEELVTVLMEQIDNMKKGTSNAG